MSRAWVDTNGNIILPGAEAIGGAQEKPGLAIEEDGQVTLIATDDPSLIWEEMEVTYPSIPDRARGHWELLRHHALALRVRLHGVAMGAVLEGAQQYGTSARDMHQIAMGINDVLRGGVRSIWAFLRQPVWVPGRKRPKQYSRSSLFALDVLRFGGTFALLFGVLFVALNYASFWEILRSRLDPLSHTQLVQNLQKEVDGALQNALSAPTIVAREGDFLSHLPLVGPPVNRLIIPRLGLNVPIITPANTNLLKQDWAALEMDIQASLQDGVVHYPGTAVAGQAGNFFITGHSSYYPFLPGKYKSVFARLNELNAGDEYWVYFRGDKHRYIIQSKDEVKPSDVKVLDQPVDRRLSTLMTCTPVGTTLRRLVIVAQEVNPSTGIAMHVGDHATQAALPQVQVQVESLPI